MEYSNKDIERWERSIKDAKDDIDYYQRRIDAAGGKSVKLTWRQKIRWIVEIIKNN
jgi:hypothetical protein